MLKTVAPLSRKLSATRCKPPKQTAICTVTAQKALKKPQRNTTAYANGIITKTNTVFYARCCLTEAIEKPRTIHF